MSATSLAARSRNPLRFLVLLATLCGSTACTALFEEDAPPEAFVQHARAILGDVDFTLFHVPSRGLLRDRQYIEACRVGQPPDHLAGKLADVLRRGVDGQATVCVAGAGSEKTASVLEDAFDQLGPVQLPGLDLVVIVERHHEYAVRHAARRSGCQLRVSILER